MFQKICKYEKFYVGTEIFNLFDFCLDSKNDAFFEIVVSCSDVNTFQAFVFFLQEKNKIESFWILFICEFEVSYTET